MKTKVGDITSVEHGIIVQQVNAQGAMNSGVAKAIRQKYPVVYEVYSNTVHPGNDYGLSHMGRMIPVKINEDLYVANIVGQQFYGKDKKKYTSYDALDTGFKAIAEIMKSDDFPIHVPLIGSGLGGGHWPVVKQIIEHRLENLDVTLWLQPGMLEPLPKVYNKVPNIERNEDGSCVMCDEFSCICYTRK